MSASVTPSQSGEGDSNPLPQPSPTPQKNNFASAALTLGVLALCGGITAIPGVICGVLGIRSARILGGVGKGTAIAGLVLSGCGFLMPGLLYLAATWVVHAELSINRSNNLKQISLGQLTHNDTQGRLHRPYFYEGPKGAEPEKLSDRLSWRVELIPYLEADPLYTQFKRNEPWHSPANRPHADVVFRRYCDPESETDPDTRYRIFYGGGSAFDLGGSLDANKIPDGAGNTIAVVEGGEKVTWTQFNEYPFSMNGPLPTLGRANAKSFQAAMFDGSVRTIRKSIDPDVLKSGIHAGDGLPLGE